MRVIWLQNYCFFLNCANKKEKTFNFIKNACSSQLFFISLHQNWAVFDEWAVCDEKTRSEKSVFDEQSVNE